MVIEIRKADGPGIDARLTRVGHAAFQDDPFQRSAIRLDDAAPDDVEQYWSWRTSRMKGRLEKPENHFYMAVETETGDIVGFTIIAEPEDFQISGPLPSHQIQQWPRVVNGAMFEALIASLDAAKQELMGERKDYWYVQYMAVHPDHQRKGIGMALLRAILGLADASGRDTYLESRPGAVKLYQSAGFKVIGQLSEVGDGQIHPVMLRKAELKT